MTKYNTDSSYGAVDNKTTLDLEDDAARVNMGGDWRMPTEAECQELIDNTTNEWTQLNGVNGRKFTSKINGNSIFIPAAGIYSDSSFNDRGFSGNIWSSSLDDSSNVDAWFLDFQSDYISHECSSSERSWGLPVRGVFK